MYQKDDEDEMEENILIHSNRRVLYICVSFILFDW